MRVVILDRDGVINEDRDDFVKNSLEWIPLPRSLEAIAQFSQAGGGVVGGIGRGLYDMHALNAMHEKMHHLVGKVGGRIDAVFFCPHRPDIGCACRKPNPGMVKDIAERFGPKPERLILGGDSRRDLRAVAPVGGLPVLVKTGKGAATFEAGDLPANTRVYTDLFDAAHDLIATFGEG